MTTLSTQADSSVEVECAGCRQPGPQSDLERFVYHESVGLMFDMRGGAPGREVFVHPLPGCIRAAAWAGFSRALATPLEDLDGDELVEQVAEGVKTRLEEQIREANRLDELAVGRTNVERAAGHDRLALLLVDESAGDDAKRFAKRQKETSDADVFDDFPEGVLTDAIGTKVVIAGVPDGENVEAIGRTAEKLICIESDEG